jgi:hypothetical protein
MKPVYINNSQQKAKGKIYSPKYVQKTPFLQSTRLEPIPDKVTWYLNWDDVLFRPSYYVGTPRLQRM